MQRFVWLLMLGLVFFASGAEAQTVSASVSPKFSLEGFAGPMGVMGTDEYVGDIVYYRTGFKDAAGLDTVSVVDYSFSRKPLILQPTSRSPAVFQGTVRFHFNNSYALGLTGFKFSASDQLAGVITTPPSAVVNGMEWYYINFISLWGHSNLVPVWNDKEKSGFSPIWYEMQMFLSLRRGDIFFERRFVYPSWSGVVAVGVTVLDFKHTMNIIMRQYAYLKSGFHYIDFNNFITITNPASVKPEKFLAGPVINFSLQKKWRWIDYSFSFGQGIVFGRIKEKGLFLDIDDMNYTYALVRDTTRYYERYEGRDKFRFTEMAYVPISDFAVTIAINIGSYFTIGSKAFSSVYWHLPITPTFERPWDFAPSGLYWERRAKTIIVSGVAFFVSVRF